MPSEKEYRWEKERREREDKQFRRIMGLDDDDKPKESNWLDGMFERTITTHQRKDIGSNTWRDETPSTLRGRLFIRSEDIN